MSTEIDTDRYDPTTPEELLALAKHLAADPKLDAIFRRVGLHKQFNRPDEYGQVLASRRAFAPQLEDRTCSSDNLPVAQALARRLHTGSIASDAKALAFLADRVRHYRNEFKGRSRLLESEVKGHHEEFARFGIFPTVRRLQAAQSGDHQDGHQYL